MRILSITLFAIAAASISLVLFSENIREQAPAHTAIAVAPHTMPDTTTNTLPTPAEKPEVEEDQKRESPHTKPEVPAIPIQEEPATAQQHAVAEPPPAPPQPEVQIVKPLYETPAQSFDVVNTITLPAVVNILCPTSSQSKISGATGSGIIIDPRGVILTNAHVAQYLLLDEHPSVDTACVIRTGAPAREQYTAELLAFPSTWAERHAQDILARYPTGTGEHDWALLYITGTTNGAEKPSTFPFISYDVREKVAITHDPALIAGYPAGFLGSATLRRDLWPSSSVIAIQRVYTFKDVLVDVLSLGGSVVAQSGASGGAVVNAWGKLVGLIVTSSLADTTDERDLRAITLSHIDRSIHAHTGLRLDAYLSEGTFEAKVENFKIHHAPYLLEAFPL